MKLYERFADKEFHTSIATSFGIDFDAYENIVLPQLRGAGCRNNLILADGRMLTHALCGASALPHYAGRLYTINGLSAQGVFHPKLFLQVGRRRGRLIVSSANLTTPGLGGNLELAGMVVSDEPDSGEQRLVAAGHDGAPPDGGLRMTDSTNSIRVVIPLTIRKRNGRPKILPPDEVALRNGRAQDPHVLRAIARAWSWRQCLESGAASTIQDIAAAEKVSDRFVSRMMRLAYLSPEVLEHLVIRRVPPALSLNDLVAVADRPWAEQMGIVFEGCLP